MRMDENACRKSTLHLMSAMLVFTAVAVITILLDSQEAALAVADTTCQKAYGMVDEKEQDSSYILHIREADEILMEQKMQMEI